MEEGAGMTLSESIQTLPDAIRIWVLWLSVAMVATPAILLVWRETRRDGLVVLLSTVAVVVLMQLLYAQLGFVRLLGLPHLVVWTPLAIYLVIRLRRGMGPRLPRLATLVFLASIGVSLAFDYADVIRYAAGERGPIAPVPAATPG